MCGKLTCSMWVLGVHDDVRVASKYSSSPAAVLCWTSTCCWVGGSCGSFVLDVDLLVGQAAELCWTSTCWWVKRQNCVGRRPVGGSSGSTVLDDDLVLGWRVKRQYCVGRRPGVGLAGQAAVLCWTWTCCWVGGSSGSVVLDVVLLLGWRVKRQCCVGRGPVAGLADPPQSGGLQAVQSCGARKVLITRDRQTDGPVVFNAQCVVMGTWG